MKASRSLFCLPWLFDDEAVKQNNHFWAKHRRTHAPCKDVDARQVITLIISFLCKYCFSTKKSFQLLSVMWCRTNKKGLENYSFKLHLPPPLSSSEISSFIKPLQSESQIVSCYPQTQIAVVNKRTRWKLYFEISSKRIS